MSEIVEADILPPGKLNNDQLDAIRLETQNISPQKREYEKRHISDANRRLLESDYGQFIPQPESDSNIADRFLFMDRDTREQFLPEWTKIESVNLLPSIARHAGVVGEWGHFIAGGWDWWDQLPESVVQGFKTKFKDQFGIEDEAVVAQIVNDTANDDSYLHEVTHLYQDPTLLRAFSECGAYFYERQLRQQSQYGLNIRTREEERFASFYQNLIEKYGDDVHKLFFGSLEKRPKKKLLKI